MFYGLEFPNYPELDYELWRTFEATVCQSPVGGYRFNLVKYWRLDKSSINSSVDQLHGEAEECELRFLDPVLFPCHFEEPTEVIDLTKFGVDEVRATGVIRPALSVMAIMGLVSQNSPGSEPFSMFGAGDRFQINYRVWEVVYVRPDQKYLNSGVGLYFAVYANLLNNYSFDLPQTSLKTLPETVTFYDQTYQLPSIVMGR